MNEYNMTVWANGAKWEGVLSGLVFDDLNDMGKTLGESGEAEVIVWECAHMSRHIVRLEDLLGGFCGTAETLMARLSA